MARHPVGMNLGKSKITPLEKAAEDYAKSFRVLRPHLDFFVVNVSSPKHPNLRQLQDKSALNEILSAIQAVREAAENRPATNPQSRPSAILVKVAPDLTFEALDEILDLAVPRKIDGIVATNTTIARPTPVCAQSQLVYNQPGGLSGLPLKARSTEVIRHIFQRSGGKLPISAWAVSLLPPTHWKKLPPAPPWSRFTRAWSMRDQESCGVS